MNRLFFTSLLLLFVGLSSLNAQWESISSLSHQESFLIKFNSVFKDIQAGESWQDYRTRLQQTAKIPGQLGPGSVAGDPFYALDLKFLELPDALEGPENLGIRYMLKFYPNDLQLEGKKWIGLSDFDKFKIFGSMNEFAKRRLQKETKEKLLADAKKIKLPKRVQLEFDGGLMPYNFDKESFELRSYFIQFFDMKEALSDIRLPISIKEDFGYAFKESFWMDMKPTEAEALRNKVVAGRADSPKVKAKLYLTIKEALRSKPVYINTGNSVYSVFYPNLYSLDSIVFNLTQKDKVIQRLYATEDLPQPQGGSMSTTAAGSSSRKTNTSLPFLRFAPGSKAPVIQYSGVASNMNGSLHEVGTIQLKLLYKHYQNGMDHSLNPVPGRTMDIVGNIYFQLKDKGKKLAWQYLGRFEETKKGYRIYTGSDETAKFMKKFGYKDGYFDLIFNEDPEFNTVALLFFEGGKLQFSTTLEPLHKSVKPPFTN